MAHPNDKAEDKKEEKAADKAAAEKAASDKAAAEKAAAEKVYVVVDKDNSDYEIDEYPTKEEAQKRIALLASQGARPDRYEVKEETKGDFDKKKQQQGKSAEDKDKDKTSTPSTDTPPKHHEGKQRY